VDDTSVEGTSAEGTSAGAAATEDIAPDGVPPADEDRNADRDEDQNTDQNTDRDEDQNTDRDEDRDEGQNEDREEDREEDQDTERSSALAAGLTAELAREEAAAPAEQQASPNPGTTLLDTGGLPLFPLQPPRSARELLTDHVTAMVCCAAMDTAGATPGLDWLDGPTLLVNGERAADLTPRVLSLIEDGDPAPLRAWLVESGIRPEKPVRLV
jgi:hypothetical protein